MKFKPDCLRSGFAGHAFGFSGLIFDFFIPRFSLPGRPILISQTPLFQHDPGWQRRIGCG